MMTIGSKLRTLRKARRLTQHELAQGIASIGLISQIESGRTHPSDHILKALAERLQVDPDYFAEEVARKEQSHLYRRAKSFIGMDRYLEAADILVELVESPPPQVRLSLIYGDLAQCYARARRFEEAAEVYETLADLSVTSGDTATAIQSLFQLGNIWRQLQQLEHARMYWTRASELLQRHPELNLPVAMRVHANLGRLLFQSGSVEEAKFHYEEALNLAEQFSASLDLAVVTHGLANVAIAQGRYVEAQHLTDKAQQMYAASGHDRGVNQCRVNRVHILRSMNRLDEALELAMQERNTLPFRQDALRCANLLMEAALCKQALGDLEGAIEMADAAAGTVRAESERWPQLQLMVIEFMVSTHHYEEALARIDIVLGGSRKPSENVALRLRQLKCEALLGRGENTPALLDEAIAFLDARLAHAAEPVRVGSTTFPVQ